MSREGLLLGVGVIVLWIWIGIWIGISSSCNAEATLVGGPNERALKCEGGEVTLVRDGVDLLKVCHCKGLPTQELTTAPSAR